MKTVIALAIASLMLAGAAHAQVRVTEHDGYRVTRYTGYTMERIGYTADGEACLGILGFNNWAYCKVQGKVHRVYLFESPTMLADIPLAPSKR